MCFDEYVNCFFGGVYANYPYFELALGPLCIYPLSN